MGICSSRQETVSSPVSSFRGSHTRERFAPEDGWGSIPNTGADDPRRPLCILTQLSACQGSYCLGGGTCRLTGYSSTDVEFVADHVVQPSGRTYTWFRTLQTIGRETSGKLVGGARNSLRCSSRSSDAWLRHELIRLATIYTSVECWLVVSVDTIVEVLPVQQQVAVLWLPLCPSDVLSFFGRVGGVSLFFALPLSSTPHFKAVKSPAVLSAPLSRS